MRREEQGMRDKTDAGNRGGDERKRETWDEKRVTGDERQENRG